MQGHGTADVARRGFAVAVQEAEEGKALAGTSSLRWYGQQERAAGEICMGESYPGRLGA